MIRFLWQNLWDAGTLTVGGNEQANFPVTNTQHRWWQKTWRSLNAATCALINDLGGGFDIKVAALKYNNFTAAADIDLYYDVDISFGPAEGVEHLTTISQDVMVLYFSGTRTYQYWKLTVIDAAVPDGFHELGRVFIGSYFQPAHNFAPGGGHIDYLEIADPTVGEQGHISSIIKSSLKIFRYRFECMKPADVTIVRSMYATHRKVGGFFFTEDSAYPATTTYYVRFLEQPRITPIVWGASGPYCDVELMLVETM